MMIIVEGRLAHWTEGHAPNQAPVANVAQISRSLQDGTCRLAGHGESQVIKDTRPTLKARHRHRALGRASLATMT
eukprot:1428380-Amphidinium_carterae.1